MAKTNETLKLIAQNKKAFHDYFIEETFQAGIALSGTEVKSIRSGKCSIKESYIKIDGGEARIHNLHISPYEQGNIFNKDPLRIRSLLLHKKEINRMWGAITREGYTLVPIKIYLVKSLVKIDIAIAKGKKLYDKRETIAKHDLRREMEKVFKIKNL